MDYKSGTKVFNDWKIIRLIGEGANGKVFEIENDNYNIVTKSALKMIRIEKTESDVKRAVAEGMDETAVSEYYEEIVRRIVNEIAIMSEVKGHSNIVSYEDHCVISNEEEGYWDILIRMELLTSLSDYVMEHPLTETDIIKLGYDLCNALTFCHKKGLIHRDIKPDNIFVNEEGVYKLGDFGIARTMETTTGDMSKTGTQNYMAPEVYLGKAYGNIVDIYSVGIVLYKLMNGNRLPFYPKAPNPIRYEDRTNAFHKRMIGIEKMPLPENASHPFAEIILKACAYAPEERYKSAEQMLEELKKLLILKESYFAGNQLKDDDEETVLLDTGKRSAINEGNNQELEKAWADFKTDESLSDFWLKKSLNNGNITAKFTYGMKLIATNDNDKKKVEEGLLYLEEVAEQNNKIAIIHYIETIIEGHGDRRHVEKAIKYCQNLLENAKESQDIHKYNGYMEGLNKALKKVGYTEKKVMLATASTLIGAILLLVGGLYVFKGANLDLMKQNELFGILPVISKKLLLPIDFCWNYLGNYLSIGGMFGLELIVLANIFLTVGNVKIRKHFSEVILLGAQYLCLALIVWHIVIMIKDRLMPGTSDGEAIVFSMLVYIIAVLVACGCGVFAGTCVKKICELYDKVRKL